MKSLLAAPLAAVLIAGCGSSTHSTTTTAAQDTPTQAVAWIKQTRPGAIPAVCRLINSQGARIADAAFAEDYNSTPYGQSPSAPSADRVFLALIKTCENR